MNKLNKLMIILIMSVLLTLPAFAYDQNNPLSIFFPVKDQILSYLPFVGSSSGDYVNYWFYPVEQWEIDVCMNGLTSEQGLNDQSKGAMSDGFTNIYSTITATLTAKKKIADGNEVLYEVSWYIQPKNGEIRYSVYLLSNTNTRYYIPKSAGGQYKNEVSDNLQGSTGYYPDYLKQNFTKAVLEYPSGNITVTILQEEE